VEDARAYLDLTARQEAGDSLSPAEQRQLADLGKKGYSADKANAALSDPQTLQDYEDWKEGGASRVGAHVVVGALGGGLGGALGAGVSAAAVPQIASAVDELGLAAPVRNAVVAAASTALGAAASGGSLSGAAAALNQVANNYLKHEELKAKRDELAACKDQKCRDDANRKWDEVSQRRNEAMTTSCADGASAQCRANLAELQTDMAALLANPSGTGLNRLTPEESNNLKQAAEKYRTNLEVLAQRGSQALGTTMASPDQLAQAGYLSAQEANDLKQLRLGQMVDFLGSVALPGGTKASGSKPVSKGVQDEGVSGTATTAKAGKPNAMLPEADFANAPSGLNETAPIKNTFGKAPSDSDLATHLSTGGPSVKRVEGAHAEAAYQTELKAIGGVEVGAPKEIAPGIVEHQYNTPERVAKGLDPLTKTTYDSTWTDQQILSMSKQASSQVWTEIQKTGMLPQGKQINVEVNGVPFLTSIQTDASGKVISIYSHPGKK
jgi:hypothetical protein